MTRRLIKPITLLVIAGTVATWAAPPPAAAFDPAKPICSLAGLISTLAGKVCSAARHPGRLLQAGQKLLGGHLGGAVESLSGAGGAVTKTITAAAAVAAIVGWVTVGARFALHETATVIGSTTRPELQSTWFSASYWRMAGISALMTLPFLFAASIQALLRSDLGMLLRSALGYLPLGLLAVSIAAPLTMLLLAASDELSAIVSSASGGTGASFLAHTGGFAAALGAESGSTFPVFVIGLLAVAAAITLWVELLIRSAAVYVIVLMLPLFFAALVWPARRIWAARAVEVLVALILSKFVIVAVLSLGGAALGHTTFPSLTETLAGTTLVMLAAFSPWALMRLLPLHELASGLDGLRAHGRPLTLAPERGEQATEIAQAIVRELPANLVQRGGASNGDSMASAAAVRRLAQDSDAAWSADEWDGATNGSVGAVNGDSAGPESTPSPNLSPDVGAAAPESAAGPGTAADAGAAADPGAATARDAAANLGSEPPTWSALEPDPQPANHRPPMDARLTAPDHTITFRPNAVDPGAFVDTNVTPDDDAGTVDEPARPPTQEPDGGLL